MIPPRRRRESKIRVLEKFENQGGREIIRGGGNFTFSRIGNPEKTIRGLEEIRYLQYAPRGIYAIFRISQPDPSPTPARSRPTNPDFGVISLLLHHVLLSSSFKIIQQNY